MAGGVTAVEEFMPDASLDLLADEARRIVEVPGRIIEIGCWEGRSTIAIANAVTPRMIHAVDHWQGSASDMTGTLAVGRDVHAAWVENVRAATDLNVMPCRYDWRDYHARSGPAPVAFLFLDADHAEGEVVEQLEAFVPLMSPGSTMCGGAYHLDGVAAALAVVFGDSPVEVTGSLWVRRMP